MGSLGGLPGDLHRACGSSIYAAATMDVIRKAIVVLAALLAVAHAAAAGPGAPACYACYCGSVSAEPQYCRLIEENDDYPAANAACSSACSGSFEFRYILGGNFCPSPPCQSHGVPAMGQRALAGTAAALLSLGLLYLWRRTVRS